MLLRIDVPRIITFQILLMATVADWLFDQTRPDLNAKYWLAGFIGAFILRLVLSDELSKAKHLAGLTVGFLSACLFATTIRTQWVPGWDEVAVWGLVGLVSDIILQILAKLLTYIRDEPSEAFDQGLEKAEKALSTWTRVKESFLSLLDVFKKPKP